MWEYISGDPNVVEEKKTNKARRLPVIQRSTRRTGQGSFRLNGKLAGHGQSMITIREWFVSGALKTNKETRYNCNSWASSTTVSWTWGRGRLMRIKFYSERRWMTTPRGSCFRLSRVRGRDDRGNGAEEAGKRTAVKQKQLAGFLFIFVALFIFLAIHSISVVIYIK